MRGHNIHFKGVIWKIIPKLSLLPRLIQSPEGRIRYQREKDGLYFSYAVAKVLKTPQFI